MCEYSVTPLQNSTVQSMHLFLLFFYNNSIIWYCCFNTGAGWIMGATQQCPPRGRFTQDVALVSRDAARGVAHWGGEAGGTCSSWNSGGAAPAARSSYCSAGCRGRAALNGRGGPAEAPPPRPHATVKLHPPVGHHTTTGNVKSGHATSSCLKVGRFCMHKIPEKNRKSNACKKKCKKCNCSQNFHAKHANFQAFGICGKMQIMLLAYPPRIRRLSRRLIEWAVSMQDCMCLVIGGVTCAGHPEPV